MSADPRWKATAELFEGNEQRVAHAGSLIVTERLVLVATDDQLAFAVPFDGLQRVEFDMEPGRPGTLTLVPDTTPDEPQVVVISPDQYEAVGLALALIGERLARLGEQTPPSARRGRPFADAMATTALFGRTSQAKEEIC